MEILFIIILVYLLLGIILYFIEDFNVNAILSIIVWPYGLIRAIIRAIKYNIKHKNELQ